MRRDGNMESHTKFPLCFLEGVANLGTMIAVLLLLLLMMKMLFGLVLLRWL